MSESLAGRGTPGRAVVTNGVSESTGTGLVTGTSLVSGYRRRRDSESVTLSLPVTVSGYVPESSGVSSLCLRGSFPGPGPGLRVRLVAGLITSRRIHWQCLDQPPSSHGHVSGGRWSRSTHVPTDCSSHVSSGLSSHGLYTRDQGGGGHKVLGRGDQLKLSSQRSAPATVTGTCGVWAARPPIRVHHSTLLTPPTPPSAPLS